VWIRSDQRDRGAASLEYTGAVLIAGAVVLVVLASFTLQSVGVGQRVAFAVCKAITIGGDCGTPGDPPLSQKRPSDSCVLSDNSVSANREVAVLDVTAKNGRSYEVSQLSDGTYRVAEVAGAGVSVTAKGHQSDGYVGADGETGLQFRSGPVYYAQDTAELDQLINAEADDTVEDGVFGDGPVRALWEGGQRLAGALTGTKDDGFGPPDEIYAEGGVVVNAAAEATGLADHSTVNLAESEGLGVRTTKTGLTTLYLKTGVRGESNLQLLGIDTEGLDFSSAASELDLLITVTFDSSGHLIGVGTQATGSGGSKGVVSALFKGRPTASGTTAYRAELPVKNDQDRTTALAFLSASGITQLVGPHAQVVTTVPGISAMSNFQKAAAGNGTVTQQNLSTRTDTPFAVKAADKLRLDLGAPAAVSTSKLASTGGQYWDGNQWQAWTDCSA